MRENVADLKNTVDGLYTTLKCSVIRIGSLKYSATENVVISSKGIRIVAPNTKNLSEKVVLNIQKNEIVKLIVNYEKNQGKISIFVLPSCGNFIRESLEMQNYQPSSLALYFNPTSKSQCYRKIFLEIDSISEESKLTIRSLFAKEMLEEITLSEFNQMLIKVRETCIDFDDSTSPENIRQILIYPQGKGGISINTEDYMCLATDQYLNDVIIDFYLNYLRLETLKIDQSSKTHVFSSFFYKRLTTATTRQKQCEKDVKLTAAQKRHARIASWTKNVKIFEKDFIIIPINEQSHWFLAIICYPGLNGPCTMEGNIPVKSTLLPKKKSKFFLLVFCLYLILTIFLFFSAAKKLSLQIGSTTITPVSKKDESITLEDSLSERDEAEGDESDLESDDSDTEMESTTQPLKQ